MRNTCVCVCVDIGKDLGETQGLIINRRCKKEEWYVVKSILNLINCQLTCEFFCFFF